MTDIDLPAVDALAAQRVPARQRQPWDQFVEAVRLVVRGEHA